MTIQELKKRLENGSKADIRQIIKEYRDNMTPDEVARRSNSIHKNLYASPEYSAAIRIMLYASFRNEVDTKKIIENSVQSGKKVYLPLVPKGVINLDIYEIKDFTKDTIAGAFGNMEPIKDLKKCGNLDEIQLCIIPGIAFDRSGNRIGWGKGYYDAFLRSLPAKIKKLAIAYDFQVVGKVKATGRDVPIDGLITESEILRFQPEQS